MASGKVADPSTFTSSKVKEGDCFWGFKDVESGETYFQQVDEHQKPLVNGLYLKMRDSGDIIRTSMATFSCKKREVYGTDVEDEDIVGLAYIFKDCVLECQGMTTLRGRLRQAKEPDFFLLEHTSENKLWAIGRADIDGLTYVFTVYETPQTYNHKIVYSKAFIHNDEAQEYIRKKLNEKFSKGYQSRQAAARFDIDTSTFS